MKAIVVFWIAMAAASALQAQTAAKILERLDQAGPRFNAATASLMWIDYQAAIKVQEKESGTIAVKRYSRTKVHYVARFTDPDVYAVALRDRTAERYTPRNNLSKEYDIARYRDFAQKLMLLGFGMTGRELAADFEIANVRAETVASQKATHLDLTPKSAELREQVTRIELWISDETGCAAQQKFYFPGGNYKLVTFTGLKLNPKLSDSEMAFSKDAKREKAK